MLPAGFQCQASRMVRDTAAGLQLAPHRIRAEAEKAHKAAGEQAYHSQLREEMHKARLRLEEIQAADELAAADEVGNVPGRPS